MRRIEKAGTRPLETSLGEIAALKSAADLAPLVARLHLVSGSALFGFGSNQDFADSEQVIGFAAAGGLGLPDRDYYVKTTTNRKRRATAISITWPACWPAGRCAGDRARGSHYRDGDRNRASQSVAYPRRAARSV